MELLAESEQQRPKIMSAAHIPAVEAEGRPGKRALEPKAPRMIGPYRIVETIGYGTFGKVKKAVHTQSGLEVAIKAVRKEALSMQHAARTYHAEVESLERVRGHPNVVKLIELVETDDAYYCVLELAANGEVHEYIELDEPSRFHHIAGLWFRQLVGGVWHCHHNGVFHRDIKPENLLVDAEYNLKIADFGLSTTETGVLSQACGTREYAAPEVWSGQYRGAPADVWSCGVTLFFMLTGQLPMGQARPSDPQFQRILARQFDQPPWTELPAAAADLLQRMLEPDPAARITIEEIWDHPWVASIPVTLLATAPQAAESEPAGRAPVAAAQEPVQDPAVPDGKRQRVVSRATSFDYAAEELCTGKIAALEAALRHVLSSDLSLTPKFRRDGCSMQLSIASSVTGPLRVLVAVLHGPGGHQLCVRRLQGEQNDYRMVCRAVGMALKGMPCQPTFVDVSSQADLGAVAAAGYGAGAV